MPDTRVDIRNKQPGNAHRGEFLRGWSDAVRVKDAKIYRTTFDPKKNKKTLGNMGNLFGWIYGQQSLNFKLETWYRYLQTMEKGKRR